MPSVSEHFAGKDNDIKALYERLVALVKEFGTVEEDPKKTSIHLNRRTAFAGVAVRKAHIVLTIKSDRAIDNPRIFKSQHATTKRFYHDVRLTSPKDLDMKLREWLKAAYDLSE